MPKSCSEIYLGLGSNLGDRNGNLSLAVTHLKEIFQVSGISSYYLTAPQDNENQPFFLNAVLSGSTRYPPLIFLEKIKGIEALMGRVYSKGVYKGPRVIDIDILLWKDEIIETEKLTIPHKSLHERAFVMVPMVEITPELIHPLTGLKIQDHLKRVKDQEVSVFSNHDQKGILQ